MAPKVKINEFVASTARYAKKAALAADKNKDGKVSKAEAKSLPVDLRDEYGRQARKKSSITPASFASDQAAYVAAGARKADKNKDGILTAVEAKSLASALQNDYQNYAAGLEGGSGVTAGDFVGKGRGTSDPLGGKPFTKLPVSASIQTTVDALSTDSGGSPTFAAAWKGKPADLTAPLADPQAHKEFFNDLLFHGTGTRYQKDYPDYYNADGLTVTPMTAAQALADLKSGFPDGDTAKTSAEAKALVDAMKEPGARFFSLGWTNNDDASFSGIVAINQTSGQIKAAGYYNEP